MTSTYTPELVVSSDKPEDWEVTTSSDTGEPYYQTPEVAAAIESIVNQPDDEPPSTDTINTAFTGHKLPIKVEEWHAEGGRGWLYRGKYGGIERVLKIGKPSVARKAKNPVEMGVLRRRHYSELFSGLSRIFDDKKNPANSRLVELVHGGEWGSPDTGFIPYILMEYVPGQTFSDHIHRTNRKKKEDQLETLGILIRALEGVVYLHSRGIIHRDLKPSNILLHENGTDVKVSDYGTVKIIDPKKGERDGRFEGTPQYASFDQLLVSTNKINTLTVQSDIYTLGLIIYEAFAGQSILNTPTNVSIGNDTTVEIEIPEGDRQLSGPEYQDLLRACGEHRNKGYLYAIANQSYKPLDPLPEPIRQIVRVCLNPNPQLRYTALELEYHLISAAFDLGATMKQVKSWTLPMDFMKTSRLYALKHGYRGATGVAVDAMDMTAEMLGNTKEFWGKLRTKYIRNETLKRADKTA